MWNAFLAGKKSMTVPLPTIMRGFRTLIKTLAFGSNRQEPEGDSTRSNNEADQGARIRRRNDDCYGEVRSRFVPAEGVS